MYVICTNDVPFVVLNINDPEKAEKLTKLIQKGFDSRKKTGGFMQKVYVYLREIPTIDSIDNIKFPGWDNEWPRVITEV
ncbi:MAG: hypothetical protein LLF98_02430 [Clostridium sp.]|uniref:hypothetical protein n=1 Tax=Clostridium sp. TaxID=1506 RepID=UPI0025BA4EED|nr:hypothetical protein [Clostridium sp.]MCE5220139.1 hypothetical protein [Clostridium sp.]